MLQVNDIVTAYGAIEALRGVSLEAHDGDITCLLGPNGAGKTTLMMTIAGILRPRQGSILLNDENITGSSPGEIVARGIALVPENRLVFPEMSVRDNLIAGAYSRLASGKNQVLQDIDRLYQRFPTLKEREKQLAGTLSGGEQQMLAVARALMSKPRLLLMDEPSLGLAPLIVEEVFQIIRDLHDDGTSILLVEQNAHMALQVADRFCLLDQGRITFSGKPGQLSENELIRRAYLGGKQVG
jgi:branched-chain amino acid transport system ATP-binding protein|tara:strand:- start:616 stop:1338 length:723 start_codon:yes stop_codon:yes gene_type:complete